MDNVFLVGNSLFELMLLYKSGSISEEQFLNYKYIFMLSLSYPEQISAMAIFKDLYFHKTGLHINL